MKAAHSPASRRPSANCDIKAITWSPSQHSMLHRSTRQARAVARATCLSRGCGSRAASMIAATSSSARSEAGASAAVSPAASGRASPSPDCCCGAPWHRHARPSGAGRTLRRRDSPRARGAAIRPRIARSARSGAGGTPWSSPLPARAPTSAGGGSRFQARQRSKGEGLPRRAPRGLRRHHAHPVGGDPARVAPQPAVVGNEHEPRGPGQRLEGARSASTRRPIATVPGDGPATWPAPVERHGREDVQPSPIGARLTSRIDGRGPGGRRQPHERRHRNDGRPRIAHDQHVRGARPRQREDSRSAPARERRPVTLDRAFDDRRVASEDDGFAAQRPCASPTSAATTPVIWVIRASRCPSLRRAATVAPAAASPTTGIPMTANITRNRRTRRRSITRPGTPA